MKTQFFCTKWGQEDTDWPHFLAKVKDAGYDGVEISIPLDPIEREQVLAGLAQHGLLLIAQHWETVAPNWETHRTEFADRLRNQASCRPLFINSQTGKDYYPFEQNMALLHISQQIAVETGVPVVHETHRGKFSYAAHAAGSYLRQLAALRLTLDVSHWCAVAETLLADQLADVDLAIARTQHIHARVGFAQGPQVPDPRAPEYAAALAFHLGCWDQVVAQHRCQGSVVLTFTPEFGPPPYMAVLPRTGEPIANQWEINVYMMDFLRRRYAEEF